MTGWNWRHLPAYLFNGRIRRLFWFTFIVLVFLVVFFVYLYAPLPTAPLSDKRLLEFGWNTPRLQAMPQFIDAAQQTPFDGLILDIETPRHDAGLSWTIFQDERVDAASLENLSRDMKDFQWGRLTDNFLRVNVSPGSVDWFDDFEGVLFNLETVARLAHDLGFQGIMLDTEQYPGTTLYYYPAQKYRTQSSFADYSDQAYVRGQQVMQAINRGYQDVTVIYTFGLSVNANLNASRNLDRHPYGLMRPFIEGMIAQADRETTLVDGFEGSYSYHQETQFLVAYKLIKGLTRDFYTRDRQRYGEMMQASFGLWIDRPCDNGDSNTNCLGFTPHEFQQAVRLSLQYSDRYVWVYSQRFNWYTGEGIPDAWREPLANLRG